jgi:hypothetical protein
MQTYRLLFSSRLFWLHLMFPPSFLSIAVGVIAVSSSCTPLVHARCRNQPGDPGYPSAADWSTLNNTTGGRLLNVVPSAKACLQLGCTEAQWESGIFRQSIPGSMNAVGTLTKPFFSLITFCARSIIGNRYCVPSHGIHPTYRTSS